MSILVTAALAAFAQSSAPAVTVTDFAGEIRIEAGASLSARVERPGNAPAIQIEEGRAQLAIDGGQDIRRWRCYGRGEDRRVGRNRGSAEAFSALPLLIITTPEPASFSIEDSVFRGAAGDLADLDLSAGKCGGFVASNISGDANVRLSGSMDVMVGDVGGEATIGISGSGDMRLEDAGALGVRISGSGDVDAGNIAGALTVGLSGSGDVETGDVGSLDARTTGSGDIQIGAAPGGANFQSSGAGDLTATDLGALRVRLTGSGDVDAGSMTGALDVSLSGSGSVTVREGRVSDADIRASGSGGVRFGGVVTNIEVRLSGGGSVVVGAVEGDQYVRTTGSGSFNVRPNAG